MFRRLPRVAATLVCGKSCLSRSARHSHYRRDGLPDDKAFDYERQQPERLEPVADVIHRAGHPHSAVDNKTRNNGQRQCRGCHEITSVARHEETFHDDKSSNDEGQVEPREVESFGELTGNVQNVDGGDAGEPEPDRHASSERDDATVARNGFGPKFLAKSKHVSPCGRPCKENSTLNFWAVRNGLSVSTCSERGSILRALSGRGKALDPGAVNVCVPALTDTDRSSSDLRRSSDEPHRHTLPVMAAPSQTHRTEHRLPVLLVTIGALVIYLFLPNEVTFLPSWTIPAVGAVVLIPLVLANPRRLNRETKYTRWAGIGFAVGLAAVNQVYIILIVRELVSGVASGPAILLTAFGVWGTNVIAFALVYWELDKGGPVARRVEGLKDDAQQDFRFPQQESRPAAPWMPEFFDYAYFSLSNMMAFSPTDVMPLSRRSKALMAYQALTGFVLLALVISRAVNILTP